MVEEREQTSKPVVTPALIVGLLVITVSYRVFASQFDFLGNTAPLMAIAFGGAMLLGPRYWPMPVALLIASDLVLGVVNGGGGIGGYTAMSAIFYLGVAWIGGQAGRKEKIWPTMWCGTLLCGVLFYAFANTYSFFAWPGYEKSLAGWWQSQTTGVPGVQPPAWMFLRNALIADSIWCSLAGILFFGRQRAEKPVAVETA